MSFGDQDPFATDMKNPYAPPSTQSTNPLPTGTDGGNLATRGNRLGARIVDGILQLIVTVPIMFLTGYIQRVQAQQVSLAELVGWSILGLVIYIVIHGYFLATRGQTIGKMLAKIRIVDYQTEQILPLPKLVGLRDLPTGVLATIPYVGPLLNLVNVLFIFGNEKRCVHDLIAGTKVVNV